MLKLLNKLIIIIIYTFAQSQYQCSYTDAHNMHIDQLQINLQSIRYIDPHAIILKIIHSIFADHTKRNHIKQFVLNIQNQLNSDDILTCQISQECSILIQQFISHHQYKSKDYDILYDLIITFRYMDIIQHIMHHDLLKKLPNYNIYYNTTLKLVHKIYKHDHRIPNHYKSEHIIQWLDDCIKYVGYLLRKNNLKIQKLRC